MHAGACSLYRQNNFPGELPEIVGRIIAGKPVIAKHFNRQEKNG